MKYELALAIHEAREADQAYIDRSRTGRTGQTIADAHQEMIRASERLGALGIYCLDFYLPEEDTG